MQIITVAEYVKQIKYFTFLHVPKHLLFSIEQNKTKFPTSNTIVMVETLFMKGQT